MQIVVTTSPGGSNDKTAGTLERILTANKLVNLTLPVVSKPGGGSIAYAHVNQLAGDGHYLLIGSPTLLSGTIMDRSKVGYTDFTPIVSLWNDYVVFGVIADSPIKAGKNLIERLKTDPQSLTIGSWRPHRSCFHLCRQCPGHVAAGKMRLLGVAAPQRFGGALANVPTWKNTASTWSMGAGARSWAPKDCRPHKSTMRRTRAQGDRDCGMESGSREALLVELRPVGRELKAALDKEYAGMKSVLAEIGLAK